MVVVVLTIINYLIGSSEVEDLQALQDNHASGRRGLPREPQERVLHGRGAAGLEDCWRGRSRVAPTGRYILQGPAIQRVGLLEENTGALQPRNNGIQLVGRRQTRVRVVREGVGHSNTPARVRRILGLQAL